MRLVITAMALLMLATVLLEVGQDKDSMTLCLFGVAAVVISAIITVFDIWRLFRQSSRERHEHEQASGKDRQGDSRRPQSPGGHPYDQRRRYDGAP